MVLLWYKNIQLKVKFTLSPNSNTFQFSKKIGYVIGKNIRYVVIMASVVLIRGEFLGK